jgi:hypothetical protein
VEWFLIAIKIRSATSFGGRESRQAGVVRFYGVLKIPVEYDRDTLLAKLRDFLPSFSLLLY